MSLQAISGVIPSAIFSPVSAVGHMLCVWPDGRITDRYGQEVAPASLSARQAASLGLLTSGISGRRSIGSSKTARLRSFLASRFRATAAANGSTMYSLTLRKSYTPAQQLIYVLHASARRTSDSDCTGWLTPTVTSIVRRSEEAIQRRQQQRKNTGRIDILPVNPGNLAEQVELALPVMPAELPAYKNSYIGWHIKNGKLCTVRKDIAALMSQPHRLAVFGELLTGFSAMTESGEPLNPALCRWLMGYPAGWEEFEPTETQ